jgi:hypothetical protein
MIETKIIGHTCVVTLNSPPVNTWTPESLSELKFFHFHPECNEGSHPVDVRWCFQMRFLRCASVRMTKGNDE